jgi:hypothetical protein
MKVIAALRWGQPAFGSSGKGKIEPVPKWDRLKLSARPDSLLIHGEDQVVMVVE